MRKLAVFLSILLGLLLVSPVLAQGWTVAMWYGDPANLDDGWQACDGTNGTPDLRDLFIVGAGDSYTLGQTGGTITNSLSHRHQVASHRHTIGSSTSHVHALTKSSVYVTAGGSQLVLQNVSMSADGVHTHGGNSGYESPLSDYQLTGSTENRPPYIAMYYVCYSGTLSTAAVITDPMTTNYYTTTEGVVYARVRTVDTGTEITNYLLIAILLLVALQAMVWFITEGKRRWS